MRIRVFKSLAVVAVLCGLLASSQTPRYDPPVSMAEVERAIEAFRAAGMLGSNPPHYDRPVSLAEVHHALKAFRVQSSQNHRR